MSSISPDSSPGRDGSFFNRRVKAFGPMEIMCHAAINPKWIAPPRRMC
jgi:hypothetical protein